MSGLVDSNGIARNLHGLGYPDIVAGIILAPVLDRNGIAFEPRGDMMVWLHKTLAAVDSVFDTRAEAGLAQFHANLSGFQRNPCPHGLRIPPHVIVFVASVHELMTHLSQLEGDLRRPWSDLYLRFLVVTGAEGDKYEKCYDKSDLSHPAPNQAAVPPTVRPSSRIVG